MEREIRGQLVTHQDRVRLFVKREYLTELCWATYKTKSLPGGKFAMGVGTSFRRSSFSPSRCRDMLETWASSKCSSSMAREREGESRGSMLRL